MGMNGHSELTSGVWHLACGNTKPAAIELIMCVEMEAIGEAGEHRLATGFYRHDCDAGKQMLPLFELRPGELYACGLFSADSCFNAISSPANFRTFRHKIETLAEGE